ncbi:MAG: hypothetical protein EU535_05630 [Promethearchaeota archaeon]|nr:MAG: hypothetical protein EU535_05630 [Candidatus Lokiarchaeota archaeon]
MIKISLSDVIIEKFGEKLYNKSKNFPNNKINIIRSKENPIKINTIVLDNDREFHLIIDQKKGEIFHDCPSFLIQSEKEKKICIHFVKLLLSIKKHLALEILKDFENYSLTSEDFGSKKKSKNFLLLASNCFETNNCIEGLSYLNKAIINQYQCENIIENYLQRAIDNDLYLEFFEFLKSGFENDLKDYILQFDSYIEKGFKNFLNSIPNYSFFNILNIIESLDIIIQFIGFAFLNRFFEKFQILAYSSNLNEKYFAIYVIKKNLESLAEINPSFKDIITSEHLNSSKKEFLQYFLDEIENLAVIDKLKLMKKQFEILDIPKDKYYQDYKRYKEEIKELEKKVYLKKFSFLKLLIEKYNIKISRGEFRKKRNTYIVRHDEDNLKNPVYGYILKSIGFYGINESTIKSTDIGINYFIIKELFSDDLSSYPDIFYYKKQFWGELEEHQINSLDGFSLLSENINYNYDIDQHYSNINDLILIEWDLANKPRQGSIVNAYGSQISIPDQNNPLFHDLKPFDLCYCQKSPIKMESNIIKTVNVISKCSFKDAIISISKGMSFIEGYYPLSLVKAVLNKEINPFKANEIAINNPNKIFIPNYKQFIKNFRDFLFSFIKKEKDYIFEQLKADPRNNISQILTLLNLHIETAGLELDYSKLIENLFNQELDLKEFKSKFLNELHNLIKEILRNREIGSTKIFNLKKLRNTQFFKYTNQILNIRKEEFELIEISKSGDKKNPIFDLSEIHNTYYGQKFSNILKIENYQSVKLEKFNKFADLASKLDLKLNIKQI